MKESGPILIIDDDADDRELIKEVCDRLDITKRVLWFDNGMGALRYLQNASEQPFLIICDVNMPGVNGLELRKIIHGDKLLRKKAIPFVFLSTTASTNDVNMAYDMTVQGFFEKGFDFNKLKHRLELIFEYWKECRHPDTWVG
jgi:CheY-like chemotaxis protein